MRYVPQSWQTGHTNTQKDVVIRKLHEYFFRKILRDAFYVFVTLRRWALLHLEQDDQRLWTLTRNTHESLQIIDLLNKTILINNLLNKRRTEAVGAILLLGTETSACYDKKNNFHIQSSLSTRHDMLKAFLLLLLILVEIHNSWSIFNQTEWFFSKYSR